MKGLILKDIYSIWRYYRFFFILCAGLVGAGIVINNYALLLYPLFFAAMLPTSLFGMDESSGWNRFCDAMPVSRRQVVSEKYILGLILIGAFMVIAAAAALISGAGTAALSGLLFTAAVPLLSTALMMPPTFRFGREKGRYVSIFIAVLVAISAANLLQEGIDPGGWVCFLPYVSIALYALSWLLSFPLYEQYRKK